MIGGKTRDAVVAAVTSLVPTSLEVAARADNGRRTYVNAAGDRLVIVQASSAHVTIGAKIIDHTVVDGHNATVTQSPQTRCVTWAPTTGSGMQVCSDISRAKPAASSTDLVSEADLLRTANSLH